MGGVRPLNSIQLRSVNIARRFCYQLSLPTCESSAYVVEPSKNASNIVNYIVSLTVNALHMKLYYSFTYKYDLCNRPVQSYSCSHTLHKEESWLMSHHWEIQLLYCTAKPVLLSCLCEWAPSTKSTIGHGNILLWQWQDGCSLTRFFPILCRGRGYSNK